MLRLISLIIVIISVAVYVGSDRVAATPAQLRVTRLDFDGKVLFEKTAEVSVSPLGSKPYVEVKKAELLVRCLPVSKIVAESIAFQWIPHV